MSCHDVSAYLPFGEENGPGSPESDPVPDRFLRWVSRLYGVRYEPVAGTAEESSREEKLGQRLPVHRIQPAEARPFVCADTVLRAASKSASESLMAARYAPING